MTIARSYWNKNGKYQAEYDQLYADLVPSFGACETVAGELIRAVSKIAYDFYNNGMCNNASGALNYLMEWSVIDNTVFDVIYDYSRGVQYTGRYDGDELHIAVEKAVDQTVETIIELPSLKEKKNTDDMFDFEEEDFVFQEEDIDDDDYYFDDDDYDDNDDDDYCNGEERFY